MITGTLEEIGVKEKVTKEDLFCIDNEFYYIPKWFLQNSIDNFKPFLNKDGPQREKKLGFVQERETKKAVLIYGEDPNDGVWIPKSIMRKVEEEG